MDNNSNIKVWLKGIITNPWFAMVVPVFIIMFISHGFFWVTVQFLQDWTVGWYAEMHPMVIEPSVCVSSISKEGCSRLIEIWNLTESRASHHYEVSRLFQCYQFGFLSTAFWTGILMALVLFGVVRKGFDDLNPWVKGIVFGFLSSTTFFGGFPSLVSMDKNISENLNSYNNYDQISSIIENYISSGEGSDGKVIALGEFFEVISQKISESPASRIYFDSSKINAGKNEFSILARNAVDNGMLPNEIAMSAPKEEQVSNLAKLAAKKPARENLKLNANNVEQITLAVEAPDISADKVQAEESFIEPATIEYNAVEKNDNELSDKNIIAPYNNQDK